jgi:hypothetical protein
MEPGDEWPDETEGLRLLRAFLALPPEKRRRVIEFVDKLSREPDSCGEGGEASPS